MSGETEAGREMDALVAEQVMGYRWENRTPGGRKRALVRPDGCTVVDDERGTWHYRIGVVRLPAYSTDIAAAWEVAEKLKADGLYPEVHALRDGDWRCEIRGAGDVWEDADTAPLAICRAALKAAPTQPNASLSPEDKPSKNAITGTGEDE